MGLIRRLRWCAAFLLLPGLSTTLAAQQWNSPEALDLAARATEVRAQAQRDSSLRSYRTRAHGFVLFLAQVGDELQGAPRLVKADELDVEVYWRAPDLSKQIILGWRDGRWLPTDINYHRDHLGIVTNNFGNRIRIGEGDEVRDVVHPLSPDGLTRYDFALIDSLRIETRGGELLVYQLQVRPKDWRQPLVVGTLSLDATSAELVRFRFGFTPAAYLEKGLEDISVMLENARFEDRWWLPYRQEIEIRRRTQWLDFPARGIIRGRWEIGDYDFDVAIPPEVLRGPAIAGLLAASDTVGQWSQPLAESLGEVAAPVEQRDLDSLRVEFGRIAGGRVLSGLGSGGLAIPSVSDIIRVNRVQGLALGAAATLALDQRRILLKPRVAFGTSDERFTGELAISVATGPATVTLEGGRSIHDFSDVPVISGVLNSILSQEAGEDYGDYVMVDRIGIGVRYPLSGVTGISLTAGYEDPSSLAVEASPAHGSYRSNPALGSDASFVGGAAVSRHAGELGASRGLTLMSGSVAVEASTGGNEYFRATGEGTVAMPLGPGKLGFTAYGGWGTAGLPAYRSFVLGGRGTLPGEPFRAYGGRAIALGRLEWDFPIPFVAIPLGSFASTGQTISVGPFLAAGWTSDEVPNTPWDNTPGVRPVAGVAAEFLMRLLRVEAGVALKTGDVGVMVDVNPDWWGIL